MPTTTKSLPDDIVAQILLGEAAGEGPEGLMMVRDVLVNRARARKKTLEQVATAPAQFSAYARPDLAEFYQRQPIMLQNLARELVDEGRSPEYQPKYTAQHYVTESLHRNRHSPKVPSWIRKMKVVGRVGNHVLLAEP